MVKIPKLTCFKKDNLKGEKSMKISSSVKETKPLSEVITL